MDCYNSKHLWISILCAVYPFFSYGQVVVFSGPEAISEPFPIHGVRFVEQFKNDSLVSVVEFDRQGRIIFRSTLNYNVPRTSRFRGWSYDERTGRLWQEFNVDNNGLASIRSWFYDTVNFKEMGLEASNTYSAISLSKKPQPIDDPRRMRSFSDLLDNPEISKLHNENLGSEICNRRKDRFDNILEDVWYYNFGRRDTQSYTVNVFEHTLWTKSTIMTSYDLREEDFQYDTDSLGQQTITVTGFHKFKDSATKKYLDTHFYRVDTMDRIVEHNVYYDEGFTSRMLFFYNDRGQQTRRLVFESDGQVPDVEVVYSYDESGLLISKKSNYQGYHVFEEKYSYRLTYFDK